MREIRKVEIPTDFEVSKEEAVKLVSRAMELRPQSLYLKSKANNDDFENRGLYEFEEQRAYDRLEIEHGMD